MDKTKVYKIFSIVLKTIVLLLSFGYIYYKIFYNQDIDKIRTSVQLAYGSKTFVWYLLYVLFLMPVNWGIETVKWRYMILKIERITFYKSLKAVLVGITFSSFTPNRVGDYFGRALMLENSGKQEGFLITIIGSIAQTIITIVAGTIGIIWLKNFFFIHVFSLAYISYYILIIILIFLTNVLKYDILK